MSSPAAQSLPVVSTQAVAIWPTATHRPQLKKQRSLLIENTATTTTTAVSLAAPVVAMPRKVLAKQISVDQVNLSSRTWTNSFSLNRTSDTGLLRTAPIAPNNCSNSSSTNNNNNWNSVTTPTNNNNNNKKRQQYGGQKEQEYNERLKTLKRKDSRININIFLGGHQTVTNHEDINGYNSDNEGPPSVNQMYSGDGPTKGSQQEATKGTAANINNNNSRQLTASNRRAQFQAQGRSETVDSKTGRQRAASAPLRALSVDESGGPKIKSVKKIRRKKALRNFQECEEEEGGEDKAGKKSERPRSASSGCGEVETLVSLLSPEGSDSEKETEKEKVDVIPCIKNNELIQLPKTRPPSLKKVGKSVSFQDDDLLEDFTPSNTCISVKELPPSFRRNSATPLPNRGRQSRPPTAPLNSLFFKDLHQQQQQQQQQQSALTDMLFNNNNNSSSSNKKTSPNADKEKESKSVSVEASKSEVDTTMNKQQSPEPTPKPDDDENYPDNVQSVRERECYRLYQKMSNMGLNVSFDTVLRGMLTPTELRVIQKKKEIALARQATIALAEEESRAIAEYSTNKK